MKEASLQVWCDIFLTCTKLNVRDWSSVQRSRIGVGPGSNEEPFVELVPHAYVSSFIVELVVEYVFISVGFAENYLVICCLDVNM